MAWLRIVRDVALNGEEEEAVVGHCCVAFGGMAMMKPALVDRVCKVLLDVMDLCPESLIIHEVCIAKLSRNSRLEAVVDAEVEAVKAEEEAQGDAAVDAEVEAKAEAGEGKPQPRSLCPL